MSECPTKLLSDSPAENDAFGQHKNVAQAIGTLVDDEADGKAVALFGSWGSGKSTVVQILKNIFIGRKDRHVFVFDAWAHQGDPLRRSFLEQQIISLSKVKWIGESRASEDSWKATREKLARRLKITETKRVPQLTERGMWVLLAALLAPVGLAAISAASISNKWILGVAVFFSLLPLFAILITKSQTADPDERKGLDKETSEFLSLFVKRFETLDRNETIETPEPTSIEFGEIFRRLLSEALGEKGRKLVIVIDNLDRVPTSEALAVWATMRTFFEHSGSISEPQR